MDTTTPLHDLAEALVALSDRLSLIATSLALEHLLHRRLPAEHEDILLGVQSLLAGELGALDRVWSPAELAQAIGVVRAATVLVDEQLLPAPGA